MMHPQVFISGLILLLPGAVDSYEVVKGVVGHPVTLPCTYTTRGGIFTTCWGQGACPSSHCTNTLIWTNGYRVTYQRSSRYQLKGNISGGNVSLTIENVVQSDSGLYCCRVEVPGWFNDLKVTFSLEIKPEIPTSPPTRPTSTGRPTTAERPTTSGRPTTTGRPASTWRLTTTGRPMTTGRPTTLSTGPTRVPASPRVSASVPTTPAHTQTHTPDWNNTVISSDDSWNNTESIPSGKAQNNMTSGFYIGIPIGVLLLLLLVSTVVITRYICRRNKWQSLSQAAFRFSKIGALQNTVVFRSRAEDNVYIIEDSPYPTD